MPKSVISETVASERSAAPRPRRAANIRVYPMGDEALVYLPAAAVAYTLNRSALAIFELCDGRHTVSDIGWECAESLECHPEVLLPDVDRGVRELCQAGLVSFG